MLKRVLSLLLTAMLLLGCACAESVDWPTLADHASPDGTKIQRLTDEPVTLTLWCGMTSHDVTNVVGDFQNLDILKALEEKTGVHIEMIVPPIGEDANNFSLMLTSGKYADIIIGFDNNYSNGGDAAIDEGIIIDLKDMVEQYAPNYEKARHASQYREINTVTDSGRMPYFCQMPYMDKESETQCGLIIRKDVLDKLGMDMPVTFDDWHEYLTRAKDELGMTRGFGLAYTGISKYNALNAAFEFGMADVAQGGNFFVKDGKVQYGPLTEGYGQYVALMAQWFSEGLIDPDFTSTVTFDDGIAMMSSNLCAATSEHGGVLGYINSLGTAVDPDFEFVAVPYPVLEPGQQLHYGQIKGGASIAKSAAITTACKYPELALQWLDQLYTDEGFMLCNYGTEGKSYVLVDGVPQFTDLVMNNELGTSTHMMTAYAAVISWPYETNLGREFDESVYANGRVWDTNNDYSYSFPAGVTLNEEEKGVYGDYYGDIETYVNEMTVKFIMGLEPLENLDSFVETLRSLGVDEVINAYQTAYDRYMAR